METLTFDNRPAKVDLYFEKGDSINFSVELAGLDLTDYTFEAKATDSTGTALKTFTVTQDGTNKNLLVITMSATDCDALPAQPSYANWYLTVISPAPASAKTTIYDGTLYVQQK